MKMVRKFCGACGKETEQEEVKEELFKGIYIKSLHCIKCGETWRDLEEIKRAKREIRKKVKELGTLKLRRKIGRIGHNLAIRIPKDIEAQMNLKSGDYVDLYTTDNEIKIKKVLHA